MNGIKRPAVILAESEAEYRAVPDPYKSFKHPPMDMLGVLRYAQSVGKAVCELTADEIKPYLKESAAKKLLNLSTEEIEKFRI